jgi:hypothetical protein
MLSPALMPKCEHPTCSYLPLCFAIAQVWVD